MLWQVKKEDKSIVFGATRQPLFNKRGCNQPYLGRYWCPQRRWFLVEPCPFMNKKECGNFKRMCGRM